MSGLWVIGKLRKGTSTMKPECKLIGEDGNVFGLIAIVSRTLKKNGLDDQAKEMTNRVFECDSYSEALQIMGEYVDIV